MSDDLENRVRDIVVRKLRVTPEQVTRGASFIDDLGADSLDATELVLALEEEFDVSIPQKDATGLKTVGDILDYLAKNSCSVAPAKKGFFRRLFARTTTSTH